MHHGRHDHSREILAFLGILFALLAIAHSCAGCSATPSIPPEPPVVIVTPPPSAPPDTCAPGCAGKHAVCGDDTLSCTAACEDAVTHNVATWIWNFTGPNCWATAKTPAAMFACPGVSQCGDAGAPPITTAPVPVTPTPAVVKPIDAGITDAKISDAKTTGG